METLAAFVAYLTDERRMADKTVEAYQSDLAGFFGFLTQHLGEPPTPQRLGNLRARDVRSFQRLLALTTTLGSNHDPLLHFGFEIKAGFVATAGLRHSLSRVTSRPLFLPCTM